MEYSGPVYESMNTKGDRITISFTHTGNGLLVKDKDGYVKGLEIAGADHQFHQAKAVIQHDKLIVYSDKVQEPVAVHYAWADDAGDANLYNVNGYPAVPFRTDKWKGITEGKKYVTGK